jgi:hypothetical protein
MLRLKVAVSRLGLLWCFSKCVSLWTRSVVQLSALASRVARTSRNSLFSQQNRDDIETPARLSLHSKLHARRWVYSAWDNDACLKLEETDTFTSGGIVECSFLSGINLHIFIMYPFCDSTRQKLWWNCVQKIWSTVVHADYWCRLWITVEISYRTHVIVC